jgi:hypothetical protein
MRWNLVIAFCILLTAGFSILSASQAIALVDVALSFTPDTVAAGERVRVSASLTNLSDATETVNLSLTVSFGSWTVGPILGKTRLGPLQTRSGWQDVLIPRCFPPGQLVFTIVATAHDGADSEVSTLTILPPSTPCPWGRVDTENTAWAGGVSSSIMTILQGVPTGIHPVNWGSVKELFR